MSGGRDVLRTSSSSRVQFFSQSCNALIVGFILYNWSRQLCILYSIAMAFHDVRKDGRCHIGDRDAIEEYPPLKGEHMKTYSRMFHSVVCLRQLPCHQVRRHWSWIIPKSSLWKCPQHLHVKWPLSGEARTMRQEGIKVRAYLHKTTSNPPPFVNCLLLTSFLPPLQFPNRTKLQIQWNCRGGWATLISVVCKFDEWCGCGSWKAPTTLWWLTRSLVKGSVEDDARRSPQVAAQSLTTILLWLNTTTGRTWRAKKYILTCN